MPNAYLKTKEKTKRGLFFTLFALMGFVFNAFGQKNDANLDFSLSDDLLLTIEEYLESSDGTNNVDVLELVEYLEDIAQSKLDINTLTRDELNSIQLLSDIQVNNFFIYRDNFGPFISIYELQGVPTFDPRTIQRIILFLTMEESGQKQTTTFKANISDVQHELILRTQRNLETLAGSIEENGFLGDPYRYFLRYRVKTNNIQAGILAEKDIGEEWFKGRNKAGFDFYSYHLVFSDLHKNVNTVILGDYTVSMGQGLILHNQFGRGLSSFSTNIKKRNGSFRRYTARNEVNYFKGIAIDINLNNYFKFKVFASKNKIDGTLKDLDGDGIFESFSSIDESGNHRSEREAAKKNVIDRTSLGGILSFEKASTKVSVNVLSDQFDKTFERILRPDNVFFPRQQVYNNVSIDYSHTWKSVNLFGESAYSNGGGFGHLIGGLISLDPKLDLALIYRNYDRDYAAISPNSFGQGTNTNNEKGTYLGLEYRLNRSFSMNAYADFSTHPWLKFRVDSPGMNTDYLLKLNYTKKRKINAYVLFKTENQLRNSNEDSAIDFTIPQRLSKLRFHISYKVSDALEMRNRAEFSFYSNEEESYNGMMIFHDFLFRKTGSPLSFTSRLLWFDVNDFDVRIYTYENDVLNDFFVPFFNGNGIRYYLNLRYKISRPITLELRWAQIRYFDRDTISSSLNEINGNVNTNIKAQMRMKF